MRIRITAAVVACAAAVSGCTGPEPPVSDGPRTTTSASPTPRPTPEKPAAAVGAAMRRAVAGMAKVTEVVAPTYRPGTISQGLLAPCDVPANFFNPSLSEGLVDVGGFYVGSLKTAPAIYRAGGVRAEATFTLKVVAARPKAVSLATDKVRRIRCRSRVLNSPPPPVGGVIPYGRSTGALSVAGNPAMATTTRLVPDDLESDGYYPLFGYVRLITTFRGFMIEVGVLCGRPGRPREGGSIAADARTRALRLTQRVIAELR